MVKKKILITGAAGFIGFHLAQKLLKSAFFKVIGVDNLNNYYDVKLKLDRIDELNKSKNKVFLFKKIDLANLKKTKNLFKKNKFEFVIHLAAQAGVRHSLKKPLDYVKNNITAFTNILECCRLYKIKHLVYASTSSVYGNNNMLPFNESHTADHPIQFYAATKRSNELMAHAFSHLYNLPSTGLRLFTVYGPWGRPDMALFKFTKNILLNKKINLFNNGNHKRDFTYVSDVVDVICKLINIPPKKNKFLIKKKSNFKPNNSNVPFRILNVGQGKQTNLINYLREIEKNLNKKAKISFMPLQLGDIYETKADTTSLKKVIKKKKFTSIKIGIKKFIDWYKNYYKI